MFGTADPSDLPMVIVLYSKPLLGLASRQRSCCDVVNGTGTADEGGMRLSESRGGVDERRKGRRNRANSRGQDHMLLSPGNAVLINPGTKLGEEYCRFTLPIIPWRLARMGVRIAATLSAILK